MVIRSSTARRRCSSRTATGGGGSRRTSCETLAGVWLLRDTPAYLVCWQGTAVLDCEDRRQVAVVLG